MQTGNDHGINSAVQGSQICHCEEANGRRGALSARKRPWGAISGRQLHFRRGFPTIQPGTARLPRRFAPRNDKSEAFAILTVACTDCKCAAGPGCPLPYNGGCDQRECLPEIATAPSRPRNDKSEAFAILTVACTDCKCATGPGCPLPYNGGCDQRDCLPEIAPQGHFLALRAQGATSAVGLLAMTNRKRLPF